MIRAWLSLASLCGLLLACHHHAAGSPRPLDTSCVTADDCVPEPECCVDPCGAPLVNRKDFDRAKAALDCGSVKCPVAGACSERTKPACVDHACKRVPERGSTTGAARPRMERGGGRRVVEKATAGGYAFAP